MFQCFKHGLYPNDIRHREIFRATPPDTAGTINNRTAVSNNAGQLINVGEINGNLLTGLWKPAVGFFTRTDWCPYTGALT